METSKLREAHEEMQRQLTEAEAYHNKLAGAVEMLRLLIAQDEQEARPLVEDIEDVE